MAVCPGCGSCGSCKRQKRGMGIAWERPRDLPQRQGGQSQIWFPSLHPDACIRRPLDWLSQGCILPGMLLHPALAPALCVAG